MVNPIKFAVGTDLSLGLKELLKQLEQRLGLQEPIKMFIAGGMATHLYTGGRVTSDIDAEFSKRIVLPRDLLVETGDSNMLYLDPTYNSSFALMHEDYLKDALRVPIGTRYIEVFVLSPVDLIISKMARYNGPDPEDIEALIESLDISPEAIELRAQQAMAAYVGNLDYLRMNLQEVLNKARKRQPRR